MDTPEQRAAVVAEALTWKGTPYHHQSNIKGVGVDCAMFLIETYGNVGVLKKFDPRPYSSDWFLHHSEEKYLQTLIPFAKEISVRDAKSGDIILMKLGRTFSHSAIVVEGSVVIHAYMKERMVTLGDLGQLPFTGRELKAFNPFGDVPAKGA